MVWGADVGVWRGHALLKILRWGADVVVDVTKRWGSGVMLMLLGCGVVWCGGRAGVWTGYRGVGSGGVVWGGVGVGGCRRGEICIFYLRRSVTPPQKYTDLSNY